MKQAIIDLAAAVNRLADAVEKITEKGGKEISPLIPPTKKGSKKKSPQSACVRVREENPELATLFDVFWAAYPNDCPRKSSKTKCLKKYISLLKNEKDPSALHSAILAGLDRWTRCIDWQEDDGKFIKAPLVWLNNENWKDAPRAATPKPDLDDAPSAAERFLMECMAENRATRKEAAE